MQDNKLTFTLIAGINGAVKSTAYADMMPEWAHPAVEEYTRYIQQCSEVVKCCQ